MRRYREINLTALKRRKIHAVKSCRRVKKGGLFKKLRIEWNEEFEAENCLFLVEFKSPVDKMRE